MSAAQEATTRDSDEPVGLVLALDAIMPFDKDPRQSQNAEYARIKASIQAQGLDQPLVVTRPPGGNQYLIAAGGNTRLKILNELLRETGDAQFARVTCVVKPWRGESEVMLAHLRENDLRGGLTFLDKARAVCTVRQLLESEQGRITLTQSDLANQLRTRGYALSQASLSYMEYTVDILEPRLPQALRAGLAHREVIQIRTFETSARGLWNDRVSTDTSELFDEVFTALCRRYDGPDWDFVSLRQALEAEIAERLNQTVHAVRLALDARLAGVVEDALPKRGDEADEWPERVVRKPSEKAPPADTQEHRAVTVELNAQSEPNIDADPERTEAPTEPADEDDGVAQRRTSAEVVRPTDARFALPRTAPRGDVAALRAEIATVATSLASRHGLGALILPTEALGTGFLVVDVPEGSLLDQLDEAGLAQLSMIWWQLMALAEMTVAPIAYLLPHLSRKSVLYRALKAQDAGALFNSVWTLDPGQIGFRLWRTVGERDWSDLFTLMSCYRSLHQVAAAGNVELWGPTR